ncbi:hypothetical protein [Flexithrix dorotheae]|uniref:hypothetical protein n=1 Tax=Flexithrix dorotheae TaxID=70993 RepID=UPI00035EBED5|nr:hypothetical protein [Flexithrix dorotheae]
MYCQKSQRGPVLGPDEKRKQAAYLQKQCGVSIERSCKLVKLARSMWYYQSKKDDIEVIDKLTKLAEELPTRGFDEYFGPICQQGYIWNRK